MSFVFGTGVSIAAGCGVCLLEECRRKAARGTAFSALSALILATLALVVPAPAFADTVQGFEFTEDLLAGESVRINFDLDGPVLRGFVRPFRSSDTIFAVENLSRDLAAILFAEIINNELGMRVATASGSLVRLTPGITVASLERGTTAGFIQIFTDFVDLNLAARFIVSHDPGTGLTALVTPGTFGVVGPGGLNASFTAPAGTTISDLAGAFAETMAAGGYAVNVMGATVDYLPPAPGIVSFRVDGEGPEYAVGAVPEPATFLLVGFAIIGLVIRVRRRHLALLPGGMKSVLFVPVAMLVLFSESANADDIRPPSWRGAPGSTFQRWEFLTPATGVPPDASNNPFGQPLFDAAGARDLSEWRDVFPPRPGVWRIEETGPLPVTRAAWLEFNIPNQNDPEMSKDIWVQVTFFRTAESDHPFMGFGNPDGTVTKDPGIIPNVTPLDDGWFHGVFATHLLECKDEQIVIFPPDTGVVYIDQVTIDTNCVPEPQSVVLVGMGAAILGLRHLRRNRELQSRHCQLGNETTAFKVTNVPQSSSS